jgi:pimeloyl-ACP methyl ester carboxylesterase
MATFPFFMNINQNHLLIIFWLSLTNNLFTAVCKSQAPLTFRTENEQIVLGDTFFNEVKAKHHDIKQNNPDCFNPKFIRDLPKASSKLEKLGGENQIIVDEVGTHYITFFDRGSLNLLVIGSGFPVQRQRMLPFILLFPNYDILIFDYRGIAIEHTIPLSTTICPWKWNGLLSKKLAHFDCNSSCFGTKEEEDVCAIIHAIKSKKKYIQTIGIALCFSTYTFAKALNQDPTLFNKIVFDGSWPSLCRVAKTIARYPSLIWAVDNPHSKFSWLSECTWYQNSMVKLIEWLTFQNLDTPPLAFYLKNISCPTLFIQCANDCYCNQSEFEELFTSINTPHAAVITGNVHGRNHVWQAEAYKEICELFFEQPFDVFLKSIHKLSSPLS